MNILKAVQAAHDEYSKWSGRLTHTSTTTSYDPQAKAWIKRTVEYIDVGRPDSVRAANEETLEPEKLWRPKRNVISQVEQEAVAILRRHGPMTIAEMTKHCNRSRGTLQHELAKKSDVFIRVGTAQGSGKPDIIGLKGVHEQEGE